ncbi:hypothetical protein [uncultured Cohaesibacter sp.]|uniref:hypothetical protein n=1 Tax=uncultured Cohaesibacter sp. TaxID=1002546 RepID=UPI00292FB2BB|nr:hypothetical protein [uncultured Cohaesibacter sp.]
MIKSIFLKEWLKLKRVWLLVLLLNLCCMAYLLIVIRHQFQIEHSEMIWYWSFELRRLLYDEIKYIPLLTGLVIAIAQYLPEMINHRFRLSLHLPLQAHLQVLIWIGFGALMGGVIALIDMASLYLIIKGWFPTEAAASALLTAAPWFLAGWVSYFGATLVMVEPHVPQRLVYLLMSLAFLALLYLEKGYQEYDHALPVMILLALLMAPAIILPVHRYRHRS